MLRGTPLRRCSAYKVSPLSRVGIFPIHLDPPTLQHQQLFRLLLGTDPHQQQQQQSAPSTSFSSLSAPSASPAMRASVDSTTVMASSSSSSTTALPPPFWYMEPFAESLREDSQLAPFDDLILIPNTRYSISLRDSTHLAALTVLATRSIPNAHVDFTALEHPDETMPIVHDLTRRYCHCTLVHWLHDAYEMQYWSGFADIKAHVPLMLLHTTSLPPSALAPGQGQSSLPSAPPRLRSRQYLRSDAVTATAAAASSSPPDSNEMSYYSRVGSVIKRRAERRGAAHPALQREAAEDLSSLNTLADPPAAEGNDSHLVGYVRGRWWCSRGGRGEDAVEVNRAYLSSSESSWLGVSAGAAGLTGGVDEALLRTLTSINLTKSNDDHDGADGDVVVSEDGSLVVHCRDDRGSLPFKASPTAIGAAASSASGQDTQALTTTGSRGHSAEQDAHASTRGPAVLCASRNVRNLIEELYPPPRNHTCSSCSAESVDGAGTRGSHHHFSDDEIAPLIEVHPVTHCVGADVRHALWEQVVDPSVLLPGCVQRHVESHGLYQDSRKGAGACVYRHSAGGVESSRARAAGPMNGGGSAGAGALGHVGGGTRRLMTQKDAMIMSFPGVIPRLELHYDKSNIVAREQYERLKVFQRLEGEEPDLIVPIGGDGYMMHCIRKNWRRFIPFYGVNAGHVGYLLNDCATLEELFSFPLKLHTTTMLYCQAEKESETGERVLLSELAFNDAWVERSSGQTALIRILVNGEERIRRLRGDGVLVSTAAGSTAYSQALGASPVPVGAPLIQVVGSNVVSPAQWRPTHLEQEDQVEFEVIDCIKRPCRCFVDSVDVGNVRRMLVRCSRVASVTLAFSRSCDLQHKLYQVQFPKAL